MVDRVIKKIMLEYQQKNINRRETITVMVQGLIITLVIILKLNC